MTGSADILPYDVPRDADPLAPEFDRIALLIRLVARHREDKTVSGELKKSLKEATARLDAARRDGLWNAILPQATDIARTPFAADLMALALFVHARPSQCHALQALMGESADPAPSQALIHELLMLSPAEERRVTEALAPAAPLVARHLVRIDGAGPLRRLHPGALLLRRVLGAESFSVLPDGMRLVPEGDAGPPPLLLSAGTERRMWEVETQCLYEARMQRRDPRRGGGPALLFHGAPGTGKSLAARHLAARLGSPLLRLDLGRILSKWVGETEHNLSKVFEQMSSTSAAILIDEADALLGKRVAIKDGRDSAANNTVSHLLMLIEAHRGPVILTSNLRSNIDEAYLRRFVGLVEFDRPDSALRERIWENALRLAAEDEARRAAPDGALETIAARAAPIDLSPADIQSAADMATALAAGAGRPVGLGEVARAVYLVRTKSTQTFTRSDLRDLAPYLGDAP